VSPTVPTGYLGASARINSGPAPELVQAGYALEVADAPLLHRGLGLADLAHVVALAEADVVPPGDAAALLSTLLEWLDTPVEEFPYDALYGDAYNSRERELERRLGDMAGWLHTGRTRREAGRIAFRLALREDLLDLHESLTRFVVAVAAQADAHAATIWADTTYLQPA
jgi:argininosuccinate lyase